jgi:hypothetical protein
MLQIAAQVQRQVAGRVFDVTLHMPQQTFVGVQLQLLLQFIQVAEQ